MQDSEEQIHYSTTHFKQTYRNLNKLYISEDITNPASDLYQHNYMRPVIMCTLGFHNSESKNEITLQTSTTLYGNECTAAGSEWVFLFLIHDP